MTGRRGFLRTAANTISNRVLLLGSFLTTCHRRHQIRRDFHFNQQTNLFLQSVPLEIPAKSLIDSCHTNHVNTFESDLCYNAFTLDDRADGAVPGCLIIKSGENDDDIHSRQHGVASTLFGAYTARGDQRDEGSHSVRPQTRHPGRTRRPLDERLQVQANIRQTLRRRDGRDMESQPEPARSLGLAPFSSSGVTLGQAPLLAEGSRPRTMPRLD